MVQKIALAAIVALFATPVVFAAGKDANTPAPASMDAGKDGKKEDKMEAGKEAGKEEEKKTDTATK